MLDQLERPLRDLRISVTDRCNLRCTYCMPRQVYGPGHEFMHSEELLSFPEIARLARVFARLGVNKIRLTGGEPLLRSGLERLVGELSVIPGVSDLALTTNGLALAARAQRLADAGLGRVTVSLDALDPQTARLMSDTPVRPGRVLEGIHAATAAGLSPVKVNMVVRRGVNDEQLPAMAAHFRNRPEVLRFIEYMDVGSSNGWQMRDVVPAADILAAIDARWPLQALPPTGEGEVARRYRYRDGAGEIGVIGSVSVPFCATCTRARLSADGKLFTCLFARRGTDLRAMLRSGASDSQITAAIEAVWSARSDRYSAQRTRTAARAGAPDPARVEMSYIGG
jgi:cyclic pyranopterin phosphate synthase